RAEFDHGFSCLVALGHGFSGLPAIRAIWVPTRVAPGENQSPKWALFRVISRCSPRAAHGESTKARKRKQSKKGKGSAGSFERQAETVGSVVSGPGEIRLCRGEDCAEDPDDAADLAGPTTEVDQDDADYTGHDGAVHQVLPRDRRGGPECRS